MLAAIVLITIAILSPVPALAQEREALLDNIVPPLMQDAHVPGVAVALLEEGSVVTKSWGVANSSEVDLLQPRGVFEAASNGKVVSAYLIYLLAEQNILSLDDPVVSNRIISACGAPTIRQILTHTAGLGNNIGAETFTVDCQQKSSFSYAGEGYVLLNELVTLVTGQPSHKIVQEQIFTPLGMLDSTMDKSNLAIVTGHPDLLFALLTGRGPDAIRHMALISLGITLLITVFLCIKLFRFKTKLVATFLAPGVIVSVVFTSLLVLANIQVPVESRNAANDFASSLKTSAHDLALFTREISSPTLMSNASRDRLLAATAEVNSRTQWANGIGVDTSEGTQTYWHWGSNPGYQSLMVIDLDKQRAIVILTNGGGFADFIMSTRGGYYLSREVARQWLGIDGHWQTMEE